MRLSIDVRVFWLARSSRRHDKRMSDDNFGDRGSEARMLYVGIPDYRSAIDTNGWLTGGLHSNISPSRPLFSKYKKISFDRREIQVYHVTLPTNYVRSFNENDKAKYAACGGNCSY